MHVGGGYCNAFHPCSSTPLLHGTVYHNPRTTHYINFIYNVASWFMLHRYIATLLRSLLRRLFIFLVHIAEVFGSCFEHSGTKCDRMEWNRTERIGKERNIMEHNGAENSVGRHIGRFFSVQAQTNEERGLTRPRSVPKTGFGLT